MLFTVNDLPENSQPYQNLTPFTGIKEMMVARGLPIRVAGHDQAATAEQFLHRTRRFHLQQLSGPE